MHKPADSDRRGRGRGRFLHDSHPPPTTMPTTDVTSTHQPRPPPLRGPGPARPAGLTAHAACRGSGGAADTDPVRHRSPAAATATAAGPGRGPGTPDAGASGGAPRGGRREAAHFRPLSPIARPGEAHAPRDYERGGRAHAWWVYQESHRGGDSSCCH